MRTIRMILFGTLFVAIGLAIATFAVQNSDATEIIFFVWKGSYPLFLVLLISFVAGVLLTGLVSLIEVFRLEARVRKTRRAQELLEREIDALRNQPLYDGVPSSESGTSTSSLPRKLAPVEDEEDSSTYKTEELA